MNKALAVILLAVTLDAVGIGLIFPILPGLLRELTGSGEVSVLYGITLAIFAAMQFVFAPILGVLSDRFGRRPILMLSMAGAGIDYVIMALAPNIEILIAGRVVAGITAANMAVATAYIADITPRDQRAGRFGWLHACFGIGFILGPVLGGVLGDVWLRAPFLAAAVLNGINFALAVFLLPESRPGRGGRINPMALNPLAPLRWALTFKAILPLLAVFVALSFAGQVYGVVWVLFGEDRFGWGATMVGLSLAAYGLFHAGSQAFLTGPVTARLGERKTLLTGVVFEALALVVLAFSGQGWIVFALLPIFALGGIGAPALQSLLSAQAGEERQGQLQGVLTSLVSLSAIFAPLVYAFLYAAVRPVWPGAIWLFAVAVYALVLPLVLLGGASWRIVTPPDTKA